MIFTRHHFYLSGKNLHWVTRELFRDRVQLLLSFMPECQIGKVSQAIEGVSFTIKSITRILASRFLCYKICICKCQILNSTYKRMHIN